MYRPLDRYRVKTRYGFRDYPSRGEAISAARAEFRDGWPTWVKDMRKDEIIYERGDTETRT
jgi:hypothetical protein